MPDLVVLSSPGLDSTSRGGRRRSFASWAGSRRRWRSPTASIGRPCPATRRSAERSPRTRPTRRRAPHGSGPRRSPSRPASGASAAADRPDAGAARPRRRARPGRGLGDPGQRAKRRASDVPGAAPRAPQRARGPGRSSTRSSPGLQGACYSHGTTEYRLRGAHRALRVWPSATDPPNLIRLVPAKEAGPNDSVDAVPGIRRRRFRIRDRLESTMSSIQTRRPRPALPRRGARRRLVAPRAARRRRRRPAARPRRPRRPPALVGASAAAIDVRRAARDGPPRARLDAEHEPHGLLRRRRERLVRRCRRRPARSCRTRPRRPRP